MFYHRRIPVALARVFSALVVAGFLTLDAAAQEALFDAQKLATSCKGADCQLEIIRILQRLDAQNLPKDIYNTQLGVVAAILLDTAKLNPPGTQNGIANSMLMLASASTEVAQSRSMREAAAVILRGDSGLNTPIDAVAVSPDRAQRRFVREFFRNLPFRRWLNRFRRPGIF